MKIYTKEDISINKDGSIQVKNIGQIGYYWPKYDHRVCIDFSIGDSFFALTEEMAILGILGILNAKTISQKGGRGIMSDGWSIPG